MDAIELKLIKFAFAYEMHSFNAPHARPAQKIPTSSALLSQKIYIYILTKNQLIQPSGWAAPGDVGPATEIFSIWCSPLRKYVNVPISCELPSNYFLVLVLASFPPTIMQNIFVFMAAAVSKY